MKKTGKAAAQTSCGMSQSEEEVRLELHEKLKLAEDEEAAGAPGIPHRTVFAKLRRRLDRNARHVQRKPRTGC